MPLRRPIPKLSASAVPALQSSPRFRSDLLRPKTNWQEDIKYLRDTYDQIYDIWSKFRTDIDNPYNPEDDKLLFTLTNPKLNELLVGLEDVSRELASRNDVFTTLQNARYNFQTAGTYVKSGNYATATIYQSYALLKIHNLLEGLTREANRKHTGKSIKAYGYDIGGEVQEGHSPNLVDQGNAPKFDRTPSNPANQMVDSEAETDYPELAETKHKRIQWPPRNR